MTSVTGIVSHCCSKAFGTIASIKSKIPTQTTTPSGTGYAMNGKILSFLVAIERTGGWVVDNRFAGSRATTDSRYARLPEDSEIRMMASSLYVRESLQQNIVRVTQVKSNDMEKQSMVPCWSADGVDAILPTRKICIHRHFPLNPCPFTDYPLINKLPLVTYALALSPGSTNPMRHCSL
ncbi:hypothetical protein SODALDRAFT_356543 [Sodiomyces alkalinus F11]|uniref:Uncharacterized protein n=1 Tax=Sodiomyces alkalinus (strain CBS 110278 / VKM F-3762 / F11) TaxID=1314773 RepID=A0A3N2Q196_SODAK|nr:hypothetical protein SODALDRAFT_356543 [Sodiomyces alkalinus F11]ROT40533.1 hypothetical protein SODALDRAFT_356543 [Sodiomyces alkalinus F11]